MKKEQAADSWEKMAALQGDRYRLRATAPAPKPHGGQRPWRARCAGSMVSQCQTHRVPPATRAPYGDPQGSGSPDGRLPEELSPGHPAVPSHGQALRQNAQGQDEIWREQVFPRERSGWLLPRAGPPHCVWGL